MVLGDGGLSVPLGLSHLTGLSSHRDVLPCPYANLLALSADQLNMPCAQLCGLPFALARPSSAELQRFGASPAPDPAWGTGPPWHLTGRRGFHQHQGRAGCSEVTAGVTKEAACRSECSPVSSWTTVRLALLEVTMNNDGENRTDTVWDSHAGGLFATDKHVSREMLD